MSPAPHRTGARWARLGRVLALAATAWLAGCASAPPAPPVLPDSVFDDAAFGPASQPPRVDDLFTLDEPMRQFLRTRVERAARRSSQAHALVDALNADGRIRLDYDASRTRTASEAFRDGRGNCLSLLLMAAAMARELGLTATFYSARIEDSWSRSGNLLVASGHVNLGLGRRLHDTREAWSELLIDFVPSAQMQAMRLTPIDEATVVALYMNNRAVEALQAGALDDAYAWAREALRRTGATPQVLNTLGVVHLRRGLHQRAEQVFDLLLAWQPPTSTTHRHALANQALALQALGRGDEALLLRQRLAALEPLPPLGPELPTLAALKRLDKPAALR